MNLPCFARMHEKDRVRMFHKCGSLENRCPQRNGRTQTEERGGSTISLEVKRVVFVRKTPREEEVGPR